MVNSIPRLLYPRERPGTHCIGGWWVPGLIWTVVENLVPTGIQSPDHPLRNESLYQLSCPAPEMRSVSFVALHLSSRVTLALP